MKAIGKERNMKLLSWGVFATLVLAVVIATILGPDPVAMLTSGHANGAKPGAQTTLPSAARDASVDQPFDYFPDRYTNQAKEPAEPIATF
jgi:hypothetical protein